MVYFNQKIRCNVMDCKNIDQKTKCCSLGCIHICSVNNKTCCEEFKDKN